MQMYELRPLVLALLSWPLVLEVGADMEHPPPIHQDHFKDGAHNPEFDHEAILGICWGIFHH